MRVARVKLILWLTTASAVVGTIIVIVAAATLPFGSSTDTPTNPRAQATSATIGEAFAIPPLASFEAAWSLPLRRPLVDVPAPAIVATGTPTKPTGFAVRLVGTIVDGQHPRGVFMIGLSRVELKGVGDAVGGKIVAIDNNAATLLTKEKRSSFTARKSRSIPAAKITNCIGASERLRRVAANCDDDPFLHPLPRSDRMEIVRHRSAKVGADRGGHSIRRLDRQHRRRCGRTLKAASYDGESVLLAIPSAWCLCDPVATTGLPARNRRQAMAYRLEEKLPVAAEEVVADFIPCAPPMPLLSASVRKRHSSGRSWMRWNRMALPSRPYALPSCWRCSGWTRTERSREIVLFGPPIKAMDWNCLSSANDVCAWYVLPDDAKNLSPSHAGISNRRIRREITKIAATGIDPKIRTALSGGPGVQLLDTELPIRPPRPYRWPARFSPAKERRGSTYGAMVWRDPIPSARYARIWRWQSPRF